MTVANQRLELAVPRHRGLAIMIVEDSSSKYDNYDKRVVIWPVRTCSIHVVFSSIRIRAFFFSALSDAVPLRRCFYHVCIHGVTHMVANTVGDDETLRDGGLKPRTTAPFAGGSEGSNAVRRSIHCQ